MIYSLETDKSEFEVRLFMRRINILFKIFSCFFILLVLSLAGCSRESDGLIENQTIEIQETEDEIKETTNNTQEEVVEPMIIEADWADYFEEINGSAVIYDPTINSYQIYNQELALTRRSPCSTFKIISSLIALENGIIDPENSTRKWSGEVFWNDDWNKDIDFYDAFRTSCVWYFREVVDEIGKDTVQDELNKLQYGNCDISDWSGQLNTNNNNPALTGFWIESSLLISPKEQVEVMERIFGDNADYSDETLNHLKQVMLIESNEPNISFYGKTGMGKSYGVVVDSWFTGFADSPEKRIYFCVYLGETDNENVSSVKAREIAINIVSDYLN